MADDLESLKGILLGLGLKELPKLLSSFHKARELGNHVQAGRSSQGTHPEVDALHSALAPLLQHLQQTGAGAAAAAQPDPAPPAGPGMRPGAGVPTLPAMPALPRTLDASAGMGGL
mgnify:CR=1 FL=1